MISDKDLKEAMDLSMLDFTEEEYKKLKEELNHEYKEVEKVLERTDLEKEKELAFIDDRKQVLRDDIVGESMDKDDVIANAPEEQYGYFKLMNVRDE